jgi:16S rRNA (adenine1518-N6/adenine1519-N6)-dimethyltransferase
MTSSTTYDLKDWESPKSIIKDTGLSPLKSLGQNFLIEKNTLIYICTRASLSKNDAILEIGPGTGALTYFLQQENLPMLCVEHDKGLAKIIKQKFESDTTKVVHGDILKSKKEIHQEAMEFIELNLSKGRQIKLISNLPYKILSPLLWILFDIKHLWHECTFLVQKEFAEKLCAPITTKSYTPLTIIAELYFNVTNLKTVGPKQFWPEPTVKSSIIQVDNKNKNDKIDPDFIKFLKQAFSQRRKSLSKLLKPFVDESSKIEQSFLKMNIKSNVRSEELTPQQLLKLFNLIHV